MELLLFSCTPLKSVKYLADNDICGQITVAIQLLERVHHKFRYRGWSASYARAAGNPALVRLSIAAPVPPGMWRFSLWVAARYETYACIWLHATELLAEHERRIGGKTKYTDEISARLCWLGEHIPFERVVSSLPCFPAIRAALAFYPPEYTSAAICRGNRKYYYYAILSQRLSAHECVTHCGRIRSKTWWKRHLLGRRAAETHSPHATTRRIAPPSASSRRRPALRTSLGATEFCTARGQYGTIPPLQ